MEDRQCIRGWVYSFQSFTWTLKNKCIDKRDQALDFQIKLEISAYFDKKVALQILVMYNGEQNPATYKLEIVLIDGNSFDSSRIELSRVCNHFQMDCTLPDCNKFTLVSIQSHIYFIHSHFSEEDIDALLEDEDELEYIREIELQNKQNEMLDVEKLLENRYQVFIIT